MGKSSAVALFVALGAVALVFLGEVSFDSDPINLKDPASESVSTYRDLSDDENRGLYSVDGLVRDDGDGALESLIEEIGTATRNGRILHIGKFVPEDQDAKFAALDAAALFLFPVLTSEALPPPAPEQRKAAVTAFQALMADATGDLGAQARRLSDVLASMKRAELAEFERRVTATLSPWLDDLRVVFEAKPVTRETMPQDFKSLWVAPDGRLRFQVFPGEDFTAQWTMADYARDVQAAMPSATGAPVMVTFAGDAVVSSFVEASVIAAILVVLLLLVLLRRLDDVLLTAAPVALAAVLTFALMPLLGLKLNFANVIVLPLLFGLGVASAIHLVMRRRITGNTIAMMRSSTPRAVLFSTLTTLASFGGLALSPHVGMASMGVLLTIAILSILFFALIWLPGLLKSRDRPTSTK